VLPTLQEEAAAKMDALLVSEVASQMWPRPPINVCLECGVDSGHLGNIILSEDLMEVTPS
jgi:hypothetical protein